MKVPDRFVSLIASNFIQKAGIKHKSVSLFFYRVKTSLINPKHVIVQLNCQSFCSQTQFHHRIKKQTEHKRHYSFYLCVFIFILSFKGNLFLRISWLFLFWLVLVCLNATVAYTFLGKKNHVIRSSLIWQTYMYIHLTKLRRLTHQIYLKILEMFLLL